MTLVEEIDPRFGQNDQKSYGNVYVIFGHGKVGKWVH